MWRIGTFDVLLHRRRAALAALVGLAALAMPAHAGEPPAIGEQIEVSEVLLDVLVTDRQGSVIVGLGPEDFVVEEDGEPVALTGATFYSNRRFLESREAAAARRVDPARVPEDRYFVLFLHDQPGAAAEIPRYASQKAQALRDAKRWAEGKLPTDHVAVLAYDSRLKVHTDFTTDPVAVARAIDGVARGVDPGTHWPSRIDDAKASPLLAGLPRGEELGRKTTRIYDALRLVAEATGEIVGRKNLIYVGLGFGVLDSFGQFRPDERYYPDMMRALNDNNVAVYTLDLLGSDADHQLANALNVLASDTGGRYFHNFTSFTTPLQDIAQETNGYYLLSYEARHRAGEDAYQKVRVRTRNPELRVKARTGYLHGEG